MKKIILFISVLVLLSSNTTYGQAYVRWKRDGGTTSWQFTCEMAIDSSGNVYTTRTTYSGENWFETTTKYDSYGNKIWENDFVPYNWWSADIVTRSKLAADNSGNVYLATVLNSSSSYGWYIIKYDSVGIQQWCKSYSREGVSTYNNICDLIIDKEGNVYVTGVLEGVRDISGGNTQDAITLKLSSNGTVLWHDKVNINFEGFDVYSIEILTTGIDSASNLFISGKFIGVEYPWDDADLNYLHGMFSCKYDSNGNRQWLKPSFFGYTPGYFDYYKILDSYYDRTGNGYHAGIAVTYLGGVDHSYDLDLGVFKYTSAGEFAWENYYEGAFFDGAKGIVADDSGNVYVVGYSSNSIKGEQTGYLNRCSDTRDYSDYDILIIAYTPLGEERWIRRYSENGTSFDYGTNIAIGRDGMIYILGFTANECDENNILLLKYDVEGNLIGKLNYPCMAFINENPGQPSLILDDHNNNYVTVGRRVVIGDYNVISTFKFSNSKILNPGPYEKWISGETDPLLKDTLMWTTAVGWDKINVKLVLDVGTNRQRIFTKSRNISGAYKGYILTIPDTLVSFRTKFLIENAADTTQCLYSDIFRLKPYLLTRVGEDSIYYPYRKDLDQWGFWNNEADMWPSSWWVRFDYRDIDPFTGKKYPQDAGRDSVFARTKIYEYPDWVSWVNAFTINACYRDVANGIYNEDALDRWDAITKGTTCLGSCFGIAIANALVFNDKMSFTDTYPSFPSFIDPINVSSTDKVKEVIHELFVGQYGNQHMDFMRNYGYKLTPAQTVEELKDMLLEDDISFIRTIGMYNNDTTKGGGHAVLPFRLRKDDNHPEIYYIDIYDNSYPGSDNPIIVNTSDWGNQGTWTSPDWPGWGGNKWLALRDPALSYLSDPLKKSESKQPFEMSDDIIQMFPSDYTEFLITDKSGKVTGFSNDGLVLNIPGSIHIAIVDGSESLPAGFDVPFDNYSVAFRNASDTKPGVYIFTGKKTYHYQLNNAVPDQSDRFYFNDGLSVSNRNTGIKSVDLYSLISESIDDKVFKIRQLSLSQNDSVTSKILDDNKLMLVNFGSQTNYDLCLKYGTSAALQRFEKGDVPFEDNSTHIIVPVWNDLADSVLMVLLDRESNGTIDDTLFFENDLIGEQTGVPELIDYEECWLGQNYPNPFNHSTKITWYSPFNCRQTIEVYDIVGRFVTTIVDDYRPSGRHEIEFEGKNLLSGIYFYRLKIGAYTTTRKMLINQ